MTTQQEIEQFLTHAGFLPPQTWWPHPYRHPLCWRYPQPVTHEDIAQDVLGLAEQYGLRLGNWLRTTDGAIVMAAVQAVLPPIYTAEIELLAEGLTLAARVQHQRGLEELAGTVAVGVLVCVGVVVIGTVLPKSA
jgi:hypothetical protein